MKRKNSIVALAVLLPALLAACSKKEQPAPPPPKQASKPAPQPAKPAAQQPPVQKPVSSAGAPGTRLDFSRRTDPFKPYAPTGGPVASGAPGAPSPATGGQPAPAAAGETLPIQSFEVSKFRVVGIIAGFKENKALLVDPNGKGYVVQVGMQIGNNNGRITRITPNSVEIVERVKEGPGRVKLRKTVLTLAKKR